MSHLGSRVTALVDGQLSPGETEVLLAHVAGCGPCRTALDEERASRAALNHAGEVAPDPELTARLLALTPSDAGGAGRSRGARRLALAGAGVAAAAGTVAAGLVVVGGVSEPRADPHAILSAVSGHSGVRPTELPGVVGTDEANSAVVAWMEEHGWSAPSTLPPGMRVVDVELHETEVGQILEVEIAGAMAHVRLLQQRGVLAQEDAEEVVGTFVAHDEAVDLPTGVHDVALQSRNCVVLVISAADDARQSEEILDALPTEDYDSSVGARFVRGWQTLTEWGQG